MKRTGPAHPAAAKKPRPQLQQTLYLRNLNDKANRALVKHTLYVLFSTYGEVFDINMKMKGQAHVVLDTVDAAASAMRALQRVAVFGKELVIDFARAKSHVIAAAEEALAE